MSGFRVCPQCPGWTEDIAAYLDLADDPDFDMEEFEVLESWLKEVSPWT